MSKQPAKTVEQLTEDNRNLVACIVELRQCCDHLLERTDFLRDQMIEIVQNLREGFAEVIDRIDYGKMEMVDDFLRQVKKLRDDDSGGEEWKDSCHE